MAKLVIEIDDNKVEKVAQILRASDGDMAPMNNEQYLACKLTKMLNKAIRKREKKNAAKYLYDNNQWWDLVKVEVEGGE